MRTPYRGSSPRLVKKDVEKKEEGKRGYEAGILSGNGMGFLGGFEVGKEGRGGEKWL